MGEVKTLKNLQVGEKGTITKVRGAASTRRRILDMGIHNGAEVEIVRLAPLGDPIDLKIKGYHLSLRKEEAANIYVEVDE